ncbi:helix-turn-helix transcriptional regulator [Idiomarina baltica]|uniref:helix-turn-helix transcriptional regulator n=1 Tax=Idiomarina baltica TaxID=190892 RepID=UPI000A05309E|nr:helix-turn-helix domain-containing protein [Idiomarina baltica]
MKKQSNTTTAPLLTYEEVCTVLRTSQATLRRYVKQGRFPAPVKPNPHGRAVRFRYQDVKAWPDKL